MKKLFLMLALFFISNANAMTKHEVKQFIQDQPFDFNQMSQDATAYKTVLFKERERRLQFNNITNYPTPQERRRYYILHAIDVGMTIWALNNRDNIKEGNIFLSDNPSNQTLITNKLLAIPIYQNMEREQIVVMNYLAGIVIVNNLYTINRFD
tara:strand:+ start:2930 stop:3388 length:459 start_codon:yes stop_codon:yes gene_type:complete